MRILCLHGAGTNSEVFELQTAALRYELGDEHTYDFVEGTIPCRMFTGIESISDSEDGYFAYYEPHSPASFRKALEDLETYVAEEGPFDAVLAFSQGSSLAAAFILEQQSRASTKTLRRNDLPFQCALFFSGRLPYTDAGLDPSHAGVLTQQLEIPTAHIWGAHDEIEPDQHPALSQICKSETRHIFVHEGKHEIPGPRHRDSLADTVHVIRGILAEIEKRD